MKQKAPRNKTIDFSPEEGRKYIEMCLRASDVYDAPEALCDEIVIGDSFEVMERLPEKTVDLLIADPPYNISKNYHGNKFNKKDRQSYEEYTRAWVGKVIPLLKTDASIYVCCDWDSSLVIGNVLKDYFKVRNRITWQREKGRGAKTNWKNSMEDIWFATVSDDHFFDIDSVKVRKKVIAPYKSDGKPKDWEETQTGRFRNTCPGNFWDDITVPYWSMPENTAHPTQKPEKLLAKLILASCPEGGMVFDPFAGSCSTAVTAKKLGRHFLCIEQNEMYCGWGQKRLEMAETDRRIQGFEDGVFWERNTYIDRKK